MSAAVASELMPALDGLPVVTATLGGDAAVLGAARLAFVAHEARGTSGVPDVPVHHGTAEAVAPLASLATP